MYHDIIVRQFSEKRRIFRRIALWGYSSAGRALEWHSRGQRFDPAYLHHIVKEIVEIFRVSTISFV